MKKLTLNCDELRVDSFDPSPVSTDHRGTVRGHSGYGGTCYPTCGPTCAATCPHTCPNTCQYTCHYSCQGTCAYPC